MERFWEKVEKGEPNACWPWKASLRGGRPGHRYGAFWHEGRHIGAHRMAFFLTHGKWPKTDACHTCDNTVCCNPAHVTEGDNDADRVAKGRQAKGETQHLAKLKAADVVAIRAQYVPGSNTLGQHALAAKYGVYQSTIRSGLSGKTWGHLL